MSDETNKRDTLAEAIGSRVHPDYPQYDKLAAALAKAQGEMRGAIKDAMNPHLKNRYADLASVWDACRDALSRNGIAVVQAPTFAQGMVIVSTILMHSSGQTVRSDLAIPVAKSDAQGIGSALTYGRRYGLSAMVGIAPEDDDGEGAVGRAPQQAQRAAPPRPAAVRDSTVSVEDLAEIRDLCRSTRTDEAEFAKWLGAADLSELRVDQLARAKRALEAKAAKMQQEAA